MRGYQQVAVCLGDSWEKELDKAISLVGVLAFVLMLFFNRRKGFGFALKRALFKENARDSGDTLSSLWNGLLQG